MDSGPVIFGLGAAATGLGLGAARAVGDEETNERLIASAGLVRTFGGAAVAAAGDSILALAIAMSAEVVGPQPREASPV